MISNPSGTDSSTSSPAVQAVEAVLRPLARLMIDHGLQHGQIAELFKEVLVQESVDRYGVKGKEVTDSRVALLTGVHRKDVKRLRLTQGSSSKPKKNGITLPAAVVARWISDVRFLNIDLTPRALAKSPKAGVSGEPDFSTLVAEVSRDVSSRAVLDELLRLEVVTILPDGLVSLVDQGFVPQASLPEQFEFLGDSVGDHLGAAVHNLDPKRQAPPMLDQSAFSEGLSSEQVLLLHQLARQQWASVLQKFLSAASIAEQRSLNANSHQHKVRFGIFFYDQDMAGSGTDGDQSQAKPPQPRKGKSS